MKSFLGNFYRNLAIFIWSHFDHLVVFPLLFDVPHIRQAMGFDSVTRCWIKKMPNFDQGVARASFYFNSDIFETSPKVTRY